jgi:hypothetical protein
MPSIFIIEIKKILHKNILKSEGEVAEKTLSS